MRQLLRNRRLSMQLRITMMTFQQEGRQAARYKNMKARALTETYMVHVKGEQLLVNVWKADDSQVS